MDENEKNGERIGEKLAEIAQTEAKEAATPEGQRADRKTHRGVLIAAVAFAVLLIGAGVAYALLAPTQEDPGASLHQGAIAGNTESPDADDASASDEGDGGDNANAGTSDGPAAPSDETDQAALPNFTMKTADGEEKTLADFRGKPVLLNFWASWCGPCKSEMPAIQAAYERAGQDVEFLMVNMTGMSGETEQSARTLIDQEGYTFPVYYDVDGSAATAFGVTSIPQTYLIDAKGNIIGAYMGSMSESVLDEGLQLLTSSDAANPTK